MKQDVYCSSGISRLTESIKASGLYSISLITYYITLTIGDVLGPEHRSSNSNSGSLIKYQPRHQDIIKSLMKEYKTP